MGDGGVKNWGFAIMTARHGNKMLILLSCLALPACQKPIGDRDLTDADVAFIRSEVKRVEKLCPHEQPIRVVDADNINPRGVGIVPTCGPDGYFECVERETRHLAGDRVRFAPVCTGGVE
jgi:hypothetical protein